MIRIVVLGASLAGLLAGAAIGQERTWPSAPLRGLMPDNPPCSCRSPVGEVVVGKEICLATPAGGRRARCVMVLNNTSWEVEDETCVVISQLTQ